MNDAYVEAFNNKTFNKDGNESGIKGIKYYSSPSPIFQIYELKKNIKYRS